MAKINLNILFLSQDDKMVLDMMAYSVEQSLNDVSIGVLVASNEDDAMEILEFNTIDLIIADMNIETLESYKFYDKLQELRKFHDIPFVFLSSEVEDQEIAVLKGVQNFFLKPLNIDQLLERIGDILKAQKQERETYILPLDDDYNYEEEREALLKIREISQKIDTLIANDAPLIQIQQENQKIQDHISNVLSNNYLIDDIY